MDYSARNSNTTMEISIIVPFLNEEKYIKRCVKSLQRQTLKRRTKSELLFIDNGSTDSSTEIVRSLAPVKLLTETKPNVYAARNKALSVAKGEIIAFTDADCSVSVEWISTIQECFSDQAVGIVIGKRAFPKTHDPFLKYLEDYDNAKMKYVVTNGDVNTLFGFTNNMAVRKSAITKVRGFKELEVNGDTDLVQNIVKKTKYTVIYNEKMLITHLEITNCYQWYKKMNFTAFTTKHSHGRRHIKHSRWQTIFQFLRERHTNTHSERKALHFLLLRSEYCHTKPAK